MKTFEPNKNITELGIDTTRKFVVVNGDEDFNEGDVLELYNVDDTTCPYFKRISDGQTRLMHLPDLAYYEEEFKRGEKVMVKDKNNEEWSEAIYLTTIEGANYPYIVIDSLYKGKFKNGEKFGIDMFKQIKPIKEETKTKITLELTDEQLEKIKEIIN